VGSGLCVIENNTGKEQFFFGKLQQQQQQYQQQQFGFKTWKQIQGPPPPYEIEN
jgi:hypothetical protein